MRRVMVICVGRMKERFYAGAAAEYIKRLSRYCKLEIVELPEQRLPEDPSPAEVARALSREAEAIRGKLPAGAALAALCVEGKLHSSEELAGLLETWGNRGEKCLAFVIGSSFGLDEGLKQEARNKLMELMIARGIYDRAYGMLLSYGSDQASVSRLMILVTQKMEEINYERDERLLGFCQDIMSRGKYNEPVLRYLSRYEQGTVKELEKLWTTCREFGICTYELEERFLMQLLYTESYTECMEQIFRSYYEGQGQETVILAYFSYFSYQYFVKEVLVSDPFFECLKQQFLSKKPMNDSCKLAYFRWLAQHREPDLAQQEQMDALLEEYVKQNKYFAIKPPGLTRFRRCYRLGEEYAEERLRERIVSEDMKYYQEHHHEARIVRVMIPYHLKRAKLSGMQRRYFARLYRLGKLKARPYSQAYKYRDEIRKMHKLHDQYMFLADHEIHSEKDLEKAYAALMSKKERLKAARSMFYKEQARYRVLWKKADRMKELLSAEITFQNGDTFFQSEHEEYVKLQSEIEAQGYSFDELEELRDYYKVKASEHQEFRKDCSKKIRIAESLIREADEDKARAGSDARQEINKNKIDKPRQPVKRTV